MDKFYWYWLCNIPGIGQVKIKKLIDAFNTPENIYKADLESISELGVITRKDIKYLNESKYDRLVYENYLKMEKNGISIISMFDDEYPKKLRNIYDVPPCLYVKGNIPSGKRRSVAIIGSRACSEYGKNIALKLAKELSENGIDIISGMAAGIDAYGHLGAIDNGGSTFAVLGCGVDICYPACNRKIYEKITEKGGIISEYPMGTQPRQGHFPMRNRIISGLSDIIIVVEARKKSGSLITVDQALEQNREVMAVPGRIWDKTSEGCNNLIKMGAGIVTGVDDVLETLNLIAPMKKEENVKKKFCLAPDEEMVYSGLDLNSKSLDEIMISTGLNSPDATNVLMRLVLKGLVKETTRNYYAKL